MPVRRRSLAGFVPILIFAALGLSMAGATASAQEASFFDERLRIGRAAYAAGRMREAAEAFRVASFGFLESPPRLSESLARLALAEAALPGGGEVAAALGRFLEVEERFASYPSAALEPETRVAFEALLRRRVPAAKLVSIPTLAPVARGESPPPATATPVVPTPELPPDTGAAPVPAPPPDFVGPKPRAAATASTPAPTPPRALAAPILAPTSVPPAPAAAQTAPPPPPTPTPTRVPPTPAPTATGTPLPPTATPTSLPPTETPTATRTPVPPTRTSTSTPSATPTRVPATSTPASTATPTRVPPTATRTAPPPTETRTRTPTRTATSTRTPAPPTATRTAVPRSPTAAPRGPARSAPVESSDGPPRVSRMVPPVYPVEALRARIRGLVVLRVLVSETGSPLQIQVVEGAPARLTEAAVEAVGRWQFEPARRRGSPTREWTTVRIPFEAIPFPRATETPGPAATARPERAPTLPPRPVAWPEPPEPPSGEGGRPTEVFRTRGAVRFSILPAQARISVDGRYIGISEDWDARAGGGLFDLSERGPHRLHVELPGHRFFDGEIDVSPGAEESSVNVRVALEEEERLPYARLPRPSAATTGAFQVLADPADAQVTVNGRPAGPASSLGSGEPLWLPGPAVHEVTVSAPGHVPRFFRVLSAPNAPSSKAVVRVRLVPRP